MRPIDIRLKRRGYGAGETGVTTTAPAVMSAIENAVEPFGIRIEQMQLPRQKLIKLTAAGRTRNGA